jgi:hypothetical protein
MEVDIMLGQHIPEVQFRLGILQTVARQITDFLTLSTLYISTCTAVHGSPLISIVQSDSYVLLIHRCCAWFTVIVKTSKYESDFISSPLLNINSMRLHDELELVEGSHMITATFLIDGSHLSNDIPRLRIEATRVYTICIQSCPYTIAYCLTIALRQVL